MKQLGLALAQFHDTSNVLPSNGGWDNRQKIYSVTGELFTPATTDYAAGDTFRFGVGDPTLSPQMQLGSWLFVILPNIEQEAIFRTRNWTVPVTLYFCPARRGPMASKMVETDKYGAYLSGGWVWSKTDYVANAFVIPNYSQGGAKLMNLSAITDGTSQTFGVGEKAIDPEVHRPDMWYWDEPYFLGGSRGTSRTGISLLHDAQGNRFKQNWGSAHISGCQFLYLDGSVRLMSYSTSWQVIAASMSPNGGEVIPES
jgi:hypothetical protein